MSSIHYDSVVGFYSKPTPEQIEFIEKNIDQFDEKQIKDIEEAKLYYEF
ncbi:hypothetical protein [Ectobacillus sp. sgz5001026]